MLKFNLSGPVFEFDSETSFTFRRVSQKQVFQWELENQILTKRSTEETKEFAERASAGISNWEFYSGKEKSDLSSLGSRFCLDFCEEVSGVVDENGQKLDYEILDYISKLRFWDQLQEETNFIDWLSKYKAGGEKKSGSVDENN